MDEQRLKEALGVLAGEASFAGPDDGLIHRAKRRLMRNIAMWVTSFLVLAAGGYLAWPHLRPQPTPLLNASSPLEESVRSADGKLECTARLPANEIQPGDATGLMLTVRNVDEDPLEIRRPLFGRVRVLDEKGMTLDETRLGGDLAGLGPVSFPPSHPVSLVSGGTESLHVYDLNVRWPGGLRIVPICSILEDGLAEMPPMAVTVTVPGGTPGREEALERALLETDGLFEHCPPASDGSWTTGVIEAPDGDYPPMSARCSALIEEYPGFVIVGLRFVAPAMAPEVEFPAAPATPLPGTASISIARWTFLVTTADVKEVERLLGRARTRESSGYSVGISHGPDGWAADSEGICGGESGYYGIIFISPCPP